VLCGFIFGGVRGYAKKTCLRVGRSRPSAAEAAVRNFNWGREADGSRTGTSNYNFAAAFGNRRGSQ
jgi:hypothetical protein